MPDDDVVVAACDLPLLQPRSVRASLAAAAAAPDADVVVARTDRLQPALALWRRQVRRRSRAALGRRRAAACTELIDGACGRSTVAVEAADLRNVNTTGDLSAAEAVAG